MKTNLEYNWRITLGALGQCISVVKRCTIEEALREADELETEVDWIVTRISIHHEIL